MSVLVAALLAVAVLVWPTRRGTALALAASLTTRRADPRPGDTGSETDWSGRRRAAGRRLVERLVRRPDRASPEQVLALLDGLGPALSAGLAPAEALRLQVQVTLEDGRAGPPQGPSRWHAQLADLGARARDGEPLGPSWRELARAHRSPELLLLAQAWGLSERLGSPLAEAVGVTTELVREGQRSVRRVQAASAGARATMNLLTVLPLGGVGVAALLGLSPLTLYTQSTLALVSLGLGLVLLGAGRVMVRRMVRRSLHTGPEP